MSGRRWPASAALTLALGALPGIALGGCAARHRAPPQATRGSRSRADTITVGGVGFRGPENLVYDSLSDVFLVSNVNGGPTALDGNGFISRVAPDGRVLALKWIEGGRDGAALDAPKGIAIRGDTLAIADVGSVRYFDRRSGVPLGAAAMPGVMMNDVAFTPDGTLYVTNTGPDRSRQPVDTSGDLDAVYRLEPGVGLATVARGLALDRPDGVVADGDGALVTTFGARRVERVSGGASGTVPAPVTVFTLPAGRVDGLRRLADSSYLVTSWDARAVYRLRPGGAMTVELTGIESPAGVAVDTRRGRLAVTSTQGNQLVILPLR